MVRFLNWPRVPIAELCTHCVDCVNRTAPTVDYATPFKMIRTTNVRNGFIDTENVKHVTQETYERWTRRLKPQRDDVILTREAPLGEVGLVRSNETIFLGQRLFHYRTDPKKLNPNFLLYTLLAPDLQSQIRSLGSGATVEHMRVEDALALEIPTPPLQVQHRIAAILSSYDELFENNRRRIQVLEQMARALYREWFVNFRVPGYETIRYVESSIGPVPEGWEVKKLADIAEEVRRSVPKGPLDETQPYVGLEHLPRRALALDAWEIASELGSNKLAFKKGEILFGKIRPYFHKVSIAPFDGICSADTIVIRARRPEHYAIVAACVSTDEFVAHASATANGSKMPRASWDILAEYPVILPEADLAARFSRFFCSVIAQQQTLVWQCRNHRRTRDLLLPRLMSGQLTLRESEVEVESVLA